MPSSQIDQEMSWEENDVFVKEEENYDSDTTEIYEPEENEGVSYTIIFKFLVLLKLYTASHFILFNNRSQLGMEPLIR